MCFNTYFLKPIYQLDALSHVFNHDKASDGIRQRLVIL